MPFGSLFASLPITLLGMQELWKSSNNYLPFTDEETEAQSSEVTVSKVADQLVAEPG